MFSLLFGLRAKDSYLSLTLLKDSPQGVSPNAFKLLACARRLNRGERESKSINSFIVLVSEKVLLFRFKNPQKEKEYMSKKEVLIQSDLEDIIPEYLENIQETIDLFKKSLETGDWEDIRREGHKLKGHGKAYGFEEISLLGARIESHAKKQEKEEATLQVQALEEYMGSIEIKYVD